MYAYALWNNYLSSRERKENEMDRIYLQPWTMIQRTNNTRGLFFAKFNLVVSSPTMSQIWCKQTQMLHQK